MSDEIGVSVDPKGLSDLEKLIAGFGRLETSIDKMSAGVSGSVGEMVKAMDTLSRTTLATLTEMAAIAARSTEKQVAENKKKADLLVAQEEKAWEKMFFTSQKALSRIEAAQAASATKQAEAQQAGILKALEQEAAAENKRAALVEKSLQAQLATRADAYAAQTRMEQDQQVKLAAIRAKEATDAQKLAEKILVQDQANFDRRRAQEQKQQVELAAIRATAQEKQRVLDTNFLTSSLQAQIATAEKAKVYASLGGNAQATFGGAAANADLAALTAQAAAGKEAAAAMQLLQRAHAGLPGTLKASALANQEVNEVVRDAQGVFRGAAHEVGLYGLAHGQLIALLAGGALAAALHHIAVTGAEVEYNLQFLKSFSDEVKPIDMGRFIAISSGTLSNIKEAAEGVRALSEAGLGQEEALRALPDLLRLSALGEMGVAQAAEVAVESLRAFGLEVSDVTQVSDILVAVSTKTNISVKTLANDLKTTATTFAEFGGSMKDAAVLTGVLAEKGLSVAPLATAMTALLEPTKKQAEALKQIGFNAKDALAETGSLVGMMTKFNEATSKFNNQADVLASLGAVRSQKALQAVSDTEKLLALSKEVDESGGKAFNAFLSQIDTVEGAFKQLSSTVQGDFVQAFAEANPLIRQVEESLLGIAQAKETQDFLSGLAVTAARLMQVLIDNRGVVEALAVAYVGLRVVTGLTTMITAFAEAQVAAAIATKAETEALALAAPVMVETTLAEEALAAGASGIAVASARAAVAVEGFAAVTRFALAALGPITIALTLATVAWELYHNTLGKGEAAEISERVRLEQTTAALEKHTAELTKNADEMERNNRIKAAGSTAGALETITAQVQTQLAIVNSGAFKGEQLNAEVQKLVSLRNVQLSIEKEIAYVSSPVGSAASAANKAAEDRVSNLQKVATFAKQVSDLEKAPQQVKPAAAAEAESRLKDLEAQVKTSRELSTVTDAQQKQVKDFQTWMKANQSTFVKPDPKADKDALGAKLKALQDEATQAGILEASQQRLIKLQEKSGEIGPLQAVNDSLDARLVKEATIQSALEKEIKLQEQQPNSLTKVQALQAKLSDSKLRAELDTREAAQQTHDVLVKMTNDEFSLRQKTLSDTGHLQQAANEKFEHDYNLVTQRVSEDLLNGLATGMDQGTVFALSQYLGFLDKLKQANSDAALGKELQASFSATFSKMAEEVDSFAKKNTPGTGLSGVFANTLDAQKAYNAGLTEAIAKQQKLQALADQTKTPVDQKAASDALKKINDEAGRMQSLFTNLGKEIGKSLTDAFGAGGTAMGNLLNAQLQYANKQDQINNDLAKASPEKREQAELRAIKDTESAKLDALGNMASAAAGFFDVQSKGYHALMTVSKVVHAAELAMNLASIPTAMAAASAQFFAQSGWGGFAGIAAAAAVVAGFGVAVSSSGGPSAADQQAKQGAGTVLGDSKAKSDSIAKSLDILAKNSDTGLDINMGMLNALRNIENGIGGLASMVTQSLGLGGPDTISGTSRSGTGNLLGTGLGAAAGAALGGALLGGSILSGAFGILGSAAGPIGSALGALVGGVVAHYLTSVKTNLVDQGLILNQQSLGQTVAGGVQGSTYSDVNVKKSFLGITYSNSTDRTGGALSSEITQQFTAVIAGIRSGIVEAGAALGESSADFIARLDALPVAITNLSLKGLTGDQIQKQLEGVFGALGDNLAKAALPGLESFQQVGEGYLQTLARVANDYQTVDAVLKLTGQTFQQVGLDSIPARENLIALSGGLDKFVQQGQFFAKSFLSSAQQLDILREQVGSKLDLAAVHTTDQFAALVQGLDKTTETGAETYAQLMQIAPAFKTLADAEEASLKARRSLEIEVMDAQGKSVEALAARREDELAALQKTNPELITLQQSLYALQDSAKAEADLHAQRSLEIQVLEAQGKSVEALTLRRQEELAALQKTNPELVTLQQSLYAAQDAAKAEADLHAKRSLEIQVMDAQGKSVEALTERRQEELAALQKTNPELVTLQQSLYAAQDAAKAEADLHAQRSLEIQIMEAQGKSAEALTARRNEEIIALQKTNPELVSLQQTLYAVQDAAKSAQVQRGLDISLMEALGGAAQALAMKRQDELAAMDAEHRATQQAIYDAQDRAKAANDSFNVLKKLVDAAKVTAKDVYDTAVKDIQKGKDEAKAAYDAQTAIIKAQKSSADEVYKQITDATTATLNTAKDANSKLASLASSLSGTLSTLKGNLSLSTTRADAQAQIAQALSVARTTGALPSADSIKDALATLTKPSEDLFTTFVDYQRDQALTAGNLTDLNTLTGQQQSISDLQLQALQSTLDTTKAAYDAQVAGFDAAGTAAQAALDAANANADKLTAAAQAAMDAENQRLDSLIEGAQTQLDVMNGSYTALLSIDAALANFNTSVHAAISGQKAAAVAPGLVSGPPANQLESLYSSILGRQSDPAGFAFWQGKLQQGVPISTVISEFYKSPEYQLTGGHPDASILARIVAGDPMTALTAHAGGGRASGWSLVGEKGPEIVDFRSPGQVYTASQTAGMFAGGDMSELLDELQAMREENARMAEMLEAHLYAIAKTNQTMSDIEESWDKVGLPATRT